MHRILVDLNVHFLARATFLMTLFRFNSHQTPGRTSFLLSFCVNVLTCIMCLHNKQQRASNGCLSQSDSLRQTKLLHFPTYQHLKDNMDQSVGASKLSHDKLGNRTDQFKDNKRELEKCCAAKGVEYSPPSANEAWHKTRSRRQELEE